MGVSSIFHAPTLANLPTPVLEALSLKIQSVISALSVTIWRWFLGAFRPLSGMPASEARNAGVAAWVSRRALARCLRRWGRRWLRCSLRGRLPRREGVQCGLQLGPGVGQAGECLALFLHRLDDRIAGLARLQHPGRLLTSALGHVHGVVEHR